jgi:predicted MFS family arabinose efflux permease
MVAMADGPVALMLGRAVGGLGCGALIMGGVVLCTRWTPRERFPAVLGLVLGLGQVGNIFSTTPMAYLSAAIGWRGAMLVIAGVTFMLGAIYFAFVREPPHDAIGAPAEPEGLRDTIRGSWQILSDRRLWPVFVLGFVGYASLFLVWGLWGGVYLHLVHDLDLVARGNVLFVAMLGMTVGLIFFGWLAGRLGSAKRSVMIGGVGTAAVFGLLALLPQPSVAVVTVCFALIGFCGGFCGTIITHGRQFYPSHLIGRGVTVLNMMVIGGATTMQALSGVLVRLMGEVFPSEPAAVFRTLFGAIAICLAIGLLAYRRADAQPDMIGEFRIGLAGRAP